MMSKKFGYIVPLTLLIISIAVVLITAIVRESFSYQRQVRISQDRARARLLALSSLEIALSELSLVLPKEQKAAAEEKPAKQPPAKQPEPKDEEKDKLQEPIQQWALKVLPLINRWHTVEIVASTDGIEGTVSYYLASEQGKINLDELIKDSKQQTKQSSSEEDVQKAAGQSGKNPKPNQPTSNQPTTAPGAGTASVQPPQATPPGQSGQGKGKDVKKPEEDKKRTISAVVDELFKKEKEVSIRDALKKLDPTFEDPTDLMKVPQFAALKNSLFVTKDLPKKPLFLMDLFTVNEDALKLNPWLLSNSVKTLLGLKENKEVKIDKNFVRKIKPATNWSQDWDGALAKFYGKKFDALEKPLGDLLASEFEATAFSVVSYSKVGTVTQIIGALVELDEPSPAVSPKSIIYKITRLYWL